MNEILICDNSNWKLLSCGVVIMLYKVGLSFKFVDESLRCGHSNESYLTELCCGAVYYAVQGGAIF